MINALDAALLSRGLIDQKRASRRSNFTPDADAPQIMTSIAPHFTE